MTYYAIKCTLSNGEVKFFDYVEPGDGIVLTADVNTAELYEKEAKAIKEMHKLLKSGLPDYETCTDIKNFEIIANC